MKGFSTRYPLLFGAVLFFVGLVASVPIMVLCQSVGMPTEVASAVGRIVVGVAMLVIFRSCLSGGRPLSGIALAAPALVFVAWNLIYNLAGGMSLVTSIGSALICGIAPAIFEETLFRGIVIGKMREAGRGTWEMLIGPAVLFSVVHLTNAAGMDLLNVLVQTGYAFVIGLFLGAVYLASGDLVTVMVAHAAIDVSSQIFMEHPTSTSTPVFVAFAAILAAVALYSLWLTKRTADGGSDVTAA